MRLLPLPLLAALLLLCFDPPADAQPRGKPKPHLIVFKDGFTVHGIVKQDRTSFTDPVSGAPISIPVQDSHFTVDDGVRNISFSPNQVQELIPDDPTRKDRPIWLTNLRAASGSPIPGTWKIAQISEFDHRWQREVILTMANGSHYKLEQRLVLLTPRYLCVDTRGTVWTSFYLTRELGPDVCRSLVYKHADFKKTPEKDYDKRLLVYRFFLQAGWTAEAEKELLKLLDAYPAQRAKLKVIQENLNALLAVQFVKDMELAYKAGQHQEVQERLARYAKEKMASQVPESTQLRVQSLKIQYAAADKKLKAVQRFLKILPVNVEPLRRDFYRKAIAAIGGELNHDTLSRLETFLSQAQDWERALKQKRPPTQTPEELLAFALSGWLLGDGAAEKNADTARRLWEARQLVLDCQRSDDPVERKQRVDTFKEAKGVSVDVIARMIPLLPSAEPYEKLGTDPIKLGAHGTSYVLQLPPEYHPGRLYPVLLLLHHSGEKAEDELTRWGELAAKHGFILAAPVWGKGVEPEYQYSEREHAVVLNCLRDLRRRFQIDSDRVFLFGCEEGGKMAFDVGLSHPDQFAGVLPMSASPRFFSYRYSTNAQYLPFYVVNGDFTGAMAKDNRTLFKDWIRWSYPALHVEYKGRTGGFFEAEIEPMMDWMTRKKRAHPQKQLGRKAEEFKTMRDSDTSFYWLSAGEVFPRCQNSAAAWNQATPPATMQAQVFRESQINVWAHGVGNVTVWLGQGSINYSEKLKVQLNGRLLPPRTITPSLQDLLDVFCRTGDRQRLFWARIDLKP